MKKLIAMMMALVLLVSLAACTGNEETPDPTNPDTSNLETQGDAIQDNTGEENQTEDPTDGNTGDNADAGVYSLTFNGVELVPGAVFDASAVGEAEFVYEVPSCAIEGTDNVYSYGVLEVTAFDDGTGPVIYSVYLMDANTPTNEGLYLGDDLATAQSIYGAGYTLEGNQLTYQKGNTLLIMLVENDTIISIEYRMAT